MSAGFQNLQRAGCGAVSRAKRRVFGVDGCSFGFRPFWSTRSTKDARERYRNKEARQDLHGALVIIAGKIPRMTDGPNNTAMPNFEAALKRLEEIVRKLEGGELPLDTALELFEEGIQLSRFCNTTLEAAERRVEILLKSDSGQPRAVPFEAEHED